MTLQEIHIPTELLIYLISERTGGNVAPAKELLKSFGGTFIIKATPSYKLEVKAVYKEEVNLLTLPNNL